MIGWRPAGRFAWVLAVLAFALFVPRNALAQTKNADFSWDQAKRRLSVSVEFKEVIDATIRKKLQRGLPTTIVFTGALYLPGNPAAVATTAQTCKVTWLVWDEVYQVEISKPNSTVITAAVTWEGVVRKCAVAKGLTVATSNQVPVGSSVYMNAKVQVNPVSKEVVDKIKKWVSRPSGTGTAAPGDALFSTFTGLFLQRIGDAESESKFTTKTAVPTIPKPAPKKKATAKGGK